ncbi:hypothetical protein [Spirosoma linguale]|uniref:Uncharacterized protein n=1 Tax=Spirosoma linguale (strain ATCC 33905 / DSM 74 / LMG 10896 / Claus 1) TaxID=504472 RepID=D2QEN4_SPILD|nr:hypothetical protein Slin_2265 [Spirosoma linguale DSM 74]
MNYTLLLIGLVLLFAWYIRDRISGKKTTATPPPDYWGTVLKPANGDQLEDLPVNENIDSTTNPTPDIGLGRLYYGVPGRSFKGYIWNGRIITRRS